MRRLSHQRRRNPWVVLLVALVPAAFLDALLIAGVLYFIDELKPERDFKARPVKLVILDPVEKDTEEDEPEEPEFEGQIVEVAPPEVEEKPEDADYLAEHDQVVPEETRTEKFKINPEILAKQYSREEQLKMEDLVDVNVDKQSTGAQVGNDRFDPDRDGTLASLPSPWTVTNREGIQDPMLASHADAALSGAPQNDKLDERISDEVNLNTKEYLYASYLKRIRRLVNFYWNQNLDNLPASVKFSKSKYNTVVNVVLDSDGALEFIEVTTPCGSDPLDEAVVSAFKLAGPFPHPPEGLVAKDGRVYLPDMGFEVALGTARMQYQGIDPRAGVQFPGILKSPR
ncbi:MAG: energy transducer TonB [Myxococcota bacterium]